MCKSEKKETEEEDAKKTDWFVHYKIFNTLWLYNY